MQRFSDAAWERAMKVQEVILRAMAKSLCLVGGSRDHWDFRSQYAALEAAVPGAWLRRVMGPAARETESEAGAAEDGRGGAAALWGEVCGPKRAAFSREAAGGAWPRTQLREERVSGTLFREEDLV